MARKEVQHIRSFAEFFCGPNGHFSFKYPMGGFLLLVVCGIAIADFCVEKAITENLKVICEWITGCGATLLGINTFKSMVCNIGTKKKEPEPEETNE